MQFLPSLLCFLVILHCSFAPPVIPDKKEHDSEIHDDLEEYMEYHRYLREVVQALESDPDFRERLEKADDDDVRSGKIADQLDFVGHNVRTKLDEIKRREMERLRHLATKYYEKTNNLDAPDHKVPTNEHLDHSNPDTFEIEDLKRLIKKTSEDLTAADQQRREEFKEYEMQKEYENHQKLEGMTDEEKKEYEKQREEEEKAKKHHQPLHHPGSKQQLEEVWEKQDHMDQQFDPKAFFMMHDVDGNGVWDADEVKALFVKELDKMYAPNGPNKDLHERAEEMERMREHVFKEVDRNQDGLIDYREFLLETKRAEFQKDPGWQPIDDNDIYSKNEYQEYEKRRLEEMRYLQQRGLVDAHGRPIPGAEHQIHQALQQMHAYNAHNAHNNPHNAQYAQAPPQYHQGQYYPQQGVPPNVPQQGMPQQGYQQQGVPPQGNQQGYPPQGNQQGYPPQGNQQGYPPQGNQQQSYQQQVPQQQGYQQQQVNQQQGVPQQGNQQQGYQPQGVPQQGNQAQVNQQGVPQQAVPQGVPQQTVQQQAAPQRLQQQGSPQQAVPQVVQQEVPQQGVPPQAPQQNVPPQAVPQNYQQSPQGHQQSSFNAQNENQVPVPKQVSN